MKWFKLLILLLHMSYCFGEIKAVLFDCDGTLVDSEYAHYLSWKKALNELDGDLLLDDYYQYVGKSAEINAKLLSQKIGKDCPALILEMKRKHYDILCKSGIPAFVDTIAFLKLLASQKDVTGIKIGVCSAAKKADILFHLQHHEIEHLFDIVLSGQEDLDAYSDPEGVNKPKPYIYLHAMKLLNVSPEETVVIEDSASGAHAAVSAGCFTIAVPNSYTKHHDFSHTQLQLESFASMNVTDFLSAIKAKLDAKS